MSNNDKDEETAVVALNFDGIHAPRVTAKGTGLTGEKILQIAREHGIPLHEDSELANALSRIPLGEDIPQQLYYVVAEVLAFIYSLDEAQNLTGIDNQ